MAVFKCKACGGNLDITEETRITKCPFCDTQQTVPMADDDKKTNLFNRANKLRMSSDFDKAAGVYESIAAEFPEEAEAFWGLCLCKYGIEYVDDPSTGRKIPTCHRTSFECIFDDQNFSQALENSDSDMVKMYREEAKEIDRIQKSILEIASREEPFDIFICYKETDEDGQRTNDSVIAQDIYDALTDKGYKVFFARITLEDKLGQEYEPYIFSALNSAKVMLSIGTKYEYFNAVWVKNEWSRFLDLMKTNKEKMLIPCYRDIDAYDLPSEFRNLQGQDMSKIGFMQDLIRGIGKILSTEKTVAAAGTPGATVESLMTRAFDFLKDRDWQSAKIYSEKVLDINPRHAMAYLTNLMAQTGISTISEIDDCYREIRTSPDYRKFMEYADDELKKEMRPHFEKAEISRKFRVYDTASKLAKSSNMDEVRKAANLFSTIGDWEDSKAQLAGCRKKVIGNDIDITAAELKDARRNLRRAKSIFNIMASIVCLVIITGAVIMMIYSVHLHETSLRTMDKDNSSMMMIGASLVYFITGVVSISRLTGWGGIGCLIINCITCSLFGLIAPLITFIRDKIAQSRDVKGCKSVVREIENKLKKLNDELSQIK